MTAVQSPSVTNVLVYDCCDYSVLFDDLCEKIRPSSRIEFDELYFWLSPTFGIVGTILEYISITNSRNTASSTIEYHRRVDMTIVTDTFRSSNSKV